MLLSNIPTLMFRIKKTVPCNDVFIVLNRFWWTPLYKLFKINLHPLHIVHGVIETYIKGTVSEISSDPTFKDDNARYTTATLNPLSNE